MLRCNALFDPPPLIKEKFRDAGARPVSRNNVLARKILRFVTEALYSMKKGAPGATNVVIDIIEHVLPTNSLMMSRSSDSLRAFW